MPVGAPPEPLPPSVYAAGVPDASTTRSPELASAEEAAGRVAMGPPFEGMERPKLVKTVLPVYTREAMEQHIEGKMIVRCTITLDGSLANCRVIKGLPYLNEAVIEAVRQWRYEPVQFRGQPVAVDYMITINLHAPATSQRKPPP
jgi:TonB family protein